MIFIIYFFFLTLIYADSYDLFFTSICVHLRLFMFFNYLIDSTFLFMEISSPKLISSPTSSFVAFK